MGTSKLWIMFLNGGKYIWRNFQKTLKNRVLFTYACSFKKALFHETKTVAPIAV